MYKTEITSDNVGTFVHVEFINEVSFAQLTNLIDELAIIEKDHPAHRLIVDFSNVAEVAISYEDIRSLVKYIRINDTRLGSTAIVTGESTSRYYLARIYTDLASFVSRKEEKIFAGFQEAKTWLEMAK